MESVGGDVMWRYVYLAGWQYFSLEWDRLRQKLRDEQYENADEYNALNYKELEFSRLVNKS